MKNLPFYTLFLMLFLWGPTHAQPYLVKDINPGPGHSASGTTAEPGVGVNGLYFFFADDGVHGEELWRSDGTEEGTFLVKDIGPGGADADLSNLTALDSLVYFFADDGVHGTELWRSNGTEAGTYMVRDIYPGSEGSADFNPLLREAGGLLFLKVEAPDIGRELWKSDGTEAGTVLVEDLYPGFISSNPLQMVDWKDTLYFLATVVLEDDVFSSDGLCRSDGTEAGTFFIKEIAPDPVNVPATPSRFTPAGDRLFFSADNGLDGEELWASDGTEEGTAMVANLDSTAMGSFSADNEFFAFGDLLLFSADTPGNEDDLFISDGTAEGTHVLQVFQGDFFERPPFNFALYNGHVYFTADDDLVGDGLWRTDGTPEGTERVRFFRVEFNAEDPESVNMGSVLAFVAKTFDAGYELWTTDGTEAGTELFDIRPGMTDSDPAQLARVGNTLYFTADNGQVGRELWAFPLETIPLEAALSVNRDLACPGGGADSTGRLRLSVKGGVPPYTYEWNDPLAGGVLPVGLPAGDYAVTVTDQEGSMVTASIGLTGPPAFELDLSATPDVDGMQNGTAAVAVTGGTPPYSIVWNTDPPQSGPEAQGLAAGDYTVTITDANGCTAGGTVTVEMTTAVTEVREAGWRLFPNPARDWLRLAPESAWSEAARFLIRDAGGREVRRMLPGPRIDVSGLNGGMYWLEVEGKDGSLSRQPFVKS